MITHAKDQRDAKDAGAKAYGDGLPMNEPPYALARLCLAWRLGWLQAWWDDIAETDDHSTRFEQ